MRRHLPLLAVVSMLAACGGSGGGSAQPRDSTTSSPSTGEAVGQSLVVVTAAPAAVHFDQATYHARAGTVSVALRNLSAVRRSISIRGKGVDERGSSAGNGETSVVSASLEPGTYVLYSSLGGHDESGMHARLIVTG